MTWKILAMVTIKFLMLFRGSKSRSKLAAINVTDIGQLMGSWHVACYIPHPFQSHLAELKYTLSLENELVTLTQQGVSQRKKATVTDNWPATFRASSNQGWFDIKAINPYQQQFKFIYLSEDKTQAIVVGPTMNTVKILHRNTAFTKFDLDNLIARIGALGFKIKKLVRVDQSSLS